MLKDKNESLIISYITLRRWIGILGMSLPFICVLGGFLFSNLSIQESISSYYYTNMSDFFVGLMIGVSMFLLTYKGYEKRDSIVTACGGISGLGVAFFPCHSGNVPTKPVGIFQIMPTTSGYIHYGCASIFFILLAINSLFLFTLSKHAITTKKKNIRNVIYRFCGIAIIISLVLLVIIRLTLGQEGMDQAKLVLIFETIMLLAFGLSWLVKGETLFKDTPRV